MEERIYSKDSNLNDKAKHLIRNRKTLQKELSDLQNEKKSLDFKIMEFRKKIAKLESDLKNVCEHDWIRDNYLYSDLYCKKCGVWR